MAKEESGRLFSKVAKFVRSPLKDWAELDVEDSNSPDNGYSRQMLKEMIERRQRNDFVRRREFDMLRKQRKLRQSAAAGARDAAATPSSFSVNSAGVGSDGRALTLKKIDEIEEQMSQQWWKGRGPNGEPAPAASAIASPVAQDAGGTVEDGASLLDGASRPASDGAVEEAAIRFAHSDDLGAEAILLQALAPDGASAGHEESWRALLDLYRATDEPEKFAELLERYASRARGGLPEWISLPALSLGLPSGSGTTQPAALVSDADWLSPARLSREMLTGLTTALSRAGPVWSLDWRPLETIEPDAVGALRALLAHWADSPVRLRFAGAEALLAVLVAATPMNERGVDNAWWHLRLAVLRVMNRPDDFELAALNYCITYEVSPPAWEEPQGHFATLDALPLATTGVDGASSGGSPTATAKRPDGSDAVLTGALHGESLMTWQRLNDQLAGVDAPVVSCAALVRMDFAAAGTLLNWVTARAARGQRLQFVDVHRLMAAFFSVIGIADNASISLRKD